MKSSKLILEAVCLAERQEDTKGCNCGGRQIISADCLRDKEHLLSPCEYFGFSKSVSSLALTDRDGDVISAAEFFGGFDLTQEEYSKREKQWLEKCVGIIDSINDHNAKKG